MTIPSVPAAGLVQAFFVEYLLNQKHASPRTLATYRDAFRLLLRFVHETHGVEAGSPHVSRISMRRSSWPSSTISNGSGPTASAREMHGWRPYVLSSGSSKCGNQRLLPLPHVC